MNENIIGLVALISSLVSLVLGMHLERRAHKEKWPAIRKGFFVLLCAFTVSLILAIFFH